VKGTSRYWAFALGVLVIALLAGTAAANPITYQESRSGSTLGPSGSVEMRDMDLANGLTECPQAGKIDRDPKPLDQRRKDKVEQLSNGGDDRRLNQDYSCFPQDETSIAINPQTSRNIVAGANDYRLGTGSSGFYASTDNGNSWYDGIIPFPTTPSSAFNANGFLPSGGDPVVAYDRDGIAYYAQIAFNRYNDTNGVFVQRSTNGGFTWSRACVPINGSSTTDDAALCGGQGDPRLPGDGVVSYDQDVDNLANGNIQFNDKEWMTTGPRPAGVTPTCFAPETKTPIPAGTANCPSELIGVDRIYVTWTKFAAAGQIFTQGNRIMISYSDDRGHSWSRERPISGAAPYCIGSPANRCDFNQGSVPTVNPTTGFLWVSFVNGNTPDEDSYLVVRSNDGGNTFTGPYYVTPIFDLNYPRSGLTRPDCAPRGQQNNRQVLTNSCFRVNSYGNIVVDKRGGAYADDLYAVISDNRNGTIAQSNVDIFLMKSIDGGMTWIGPTRVNDDGANRNRPGFNRDCGRDPFDISGDPALCTVGVTGNDQWFPWVDISEDGDVNVVFHDRRLDTDSVASEWPTSRQRPGNYLSWFWGGVCRVSRPDSRDCVAPEAVTTTGSPTTPPDPGADPVPGQVQTGFPFRNYTISDSPYNLDYAFRAGIFMGDYENIDIVGNEAVASWTDSRNGRSSRTQVGRNPACEQSDAFFDRYSARSGAGGADKSSRGDDAYLVALCPTDISDRGADDHRGRKDNDRR
jgi:hypothetical protein